MRVKNIGEVKFNRSAYDYLLLPPQTKELVRALVETQQQAGLATDMVEGKGNGLILLLHGGPGTGKTLTAGMCDVLNLILEAGINRLTSERYTNLPRALNPKQRAHLI